MQQHARVGGESPCGIVPPQRRWTQREMGLLPASTSTHLFTMNSTLVVTSNFISKFPRLDALGSESRSFQVFRHVPAPAIMLIALFVAVLQSCTFIFKADLCVCVCVCPLCMCGYTLVTLSTAAFPIHCGCC